MRYKVNFHVAIYFLNSYIVIIMGNQAPNSYNLSHWSSSGGNNVTNGANAFLAQDRQQHGVLRSPAESHEQHDVIASIALASHRALLDAKHKNRMPKEMVSTDNEHSINEPNGATDGLVDAKREDKKLATAEDIPLLKEEALTLASPWPPPSLSILSNKYFENPSHSNVTNSLTAATETLTASMIPTNKNSTNNTNKYVVNNVPPEGQRLINDYRRLTSPPSLSQSPRTRTTSNPLFSKPTKAVVNVATRTTNLPATNNASHHHLHHVKTNGSSFSVAASHFQIAQKQLTLSKSSRTDTPTPPAKLNHILDTMSAANSKHHHSDHRYGPHFEDIPSVGNVTNITAPVGNDVYLNCRISLLQDKTVSWVRRRPGETGLELLTVGLQTYSGDSRYKIEFQYPSNWKLKIESAVKDDEGTYECQISTYPPRVIQKNLFVIDPKVIIIDEEGSTLQDKYYEVDSTLQLSCIVRHVKMTSTAVFWSHGERILNYDVSRGGVSVKTEILEKGANSSLLIAKINKSDSGNYSCFINATHMYTVSVHVLNGESFAELHHGNVGERHLAATSFNLIVIVWNILWFCLQTTTQANNNR